MINFHDFVFQNKNNKKINIIDRFVKKIKKKYDLIYFDEFQVTNIVDAMILGRLFKTIFRENIKVLISSNIRIKELYKDGLQKDQFVPFIQIISRFCIEHELIVNQDYRKLGISKMERFFYPINDKVFFQVSSIFREISKGKINKPKDIVIKGRNFIIKNYYDGIVRFDFNDLCNKNIGAEDYIKIADVCKYILIENLPNFNDNKSNQQHRFITLIDIIYEKKVKITISCVSNLKDLTSSNNLSEPFKRTLSRLYELTSSSNI